MTHKLDPSKIWEEAADLAEDLVDGGADEEKVARAVAVFLDGLVPLHILMPGVPGIIAEQFDEEAFFATTSMLIRLFKSDPEKRAARKEKRQKKRIERQHLREARKARRRNV